MYAYPRLNFPLNQYLMIQQKQIDSPLVSSYTIAVLTQNHADRMFVSVDQYRNRLVWSRKYRLAVVNGTEQEAVDVMNEIREGYHPRMTREKVGIDISTMCVLETHITFKVVRTGYI